SFDLACDVSVRAHRTCTPDRCTSGTVWAQTSHCAGTRPASSATNPTTPLSGLLASANRRFRLMRGMIGSVPSEQPLRLELTDSMCTITSYTSMESASAEPHLIQRDDADS